MQIINRNRKFDRLAKLAVLRHYGKNGKRVCCWKGCAVSDPDMLVIDHIEDNGAEERNNGTMKTGINGLKKLRALNYPIGYQTLCSNHNLKKEIMKRKKNRTTGEK